jgi:hypothetical protein
MFCSLQGMGKVKEALKDAEQCIMYNGAWDKAFTRKGAALRQSGDRKIRPYRRLGPPGLTLKFFT